MTNIAISVYDGVTEHDTGISVEVWRGMTSEQRNKVIDQVIFDHVGVQIHGWNEDDPCPTCNGDGVIDDPSACADPEHCTPAVPCPDCGARDE